SASAARSSGRGPRRPALSHLHQPQRNGPLLSAPSRHQRKPGHSLQLLCRVPDKDRFEVIHTKDIHIIPGQIDIGGVKTDKQFDIVLIHNGDKGYETTYKGTAPQDKDELQNYLRRRPHSLEWVFRKWMNDPTVALFNDGLAIVDSKPVDVVTLLNSQNDSVSVALDQITHYPIRISYSWRDPKDK